MKIAITEDLRDYLERLYYESSRYKDILRTISRNMCNMTDEEWEESLAYYQDLCESSQVSLDCALRTVEEIYPELSSSKNWRVDFSECTITDELPSAQISVKNETYIDQLSRLYPEYRDGELHINGKNAKDITLQVTDSCNMACTYCYQHNKGKHSMSFDTGKQFLDMILDSDERTDSYIQSNNCLGAVINFIGGEPLLEIDLISKLSDYFLGELFRRKHPWIIRFMFSICSNGLLYFDNRVQEYIAKHRGHLSISISIDGGKELHDSCRVDLCGNGTYDRAIAAVKHYQKVYGGNVGSKITVSPENLDKLLESIKEIVLLGYERINLNCIYEEGWTDHHARIFYYQLKGLTDWLIASNLQYKVSFSVFSLHCGHAMLESDNQNWCGGNGLMLAVDWKGDMYPCLRYMESSVGDNCPAFIIGNINEGLCKEEDHIIRVDCLSCITRKSQSTDECWNCPIASGCGWCTAYNYEYFGTPNKRATHICCMHKARSLANFYYWNRLGVAYDLDCPKYWAAPIIGEAEYEYLSSIVIGGDIHADDRP